MRTESDVINDVRQYIREFTGHANDHIVIRTSPRGTALRCLPIVHGGTLTISQELMECMKIRFTDADRFKIAHELGHLRNSLTLKPISEPKSTLFDKIKKVVCKILSRISNTFFTPQKDVQDVKTEQQQQLEFDADAFAAKRVSKEVLRAGIAYFELMAIPERKRAKSSWFSWFASPPSSTHPTFSARIARLKTFL